MTPTHIVQTVIEFIICGIAIYGLINERKIAIIERLLFRKLKRRFTK